MIRRVLLIGAILATSAVAGARTVEPGTMTVAGAVGPGFRMGSRLGGSRAYLLLGGQVEYAGTSTLTSIADFSLGLADTIPVRLRAGARYRLAGTEGPFAPYLQGQIVVGRLWDVIGANLWVLGVRGAAGADYFLSARLGVGAVVGVDVGRTLVSPSAFYNTFDVIAYASYALE